MIFSVLSLLWEMRHNLLKAATKATNGIGQCRYIKLCHCKNEMLHCFNSTLRSLWCLYKNHFSINTAIHNFYFMANNRYQKFSYPFCGSIAFFWFTWLYVCVYVRVRLLLMCVSVFFYKCLSFFRYVIRLRCVLFGKRYQTVDCTSVGWRWSLWRFKWKIVAKELCACICFILENFFVFAENAVSYKCQA